MRQKWIENIEIIILVLVAVVTILITVLDFIGALEEIAWLHERIPVLTLLAVGLVASYILLERRTKLNVIHDELHAGVSEILESESESTRLLIDSLRGVAIKQFDSDSACFIYMNKRVAQAKERVDDISWSREEHIRPGFHVEESLDQEYFGILEELTQRIPFRELLIFFDRPGRFQKLHNRIQDNWPGYSCRYFEDTEVPLLQFMVIDGEEVIVGPNPYTDSLAIQHSQIVMMFVEYYEELWQKARMLKHGRAINWEEVANILGTDEAAKLRKSHGQ